MINIRSRVNRNDYIHNLPAAARLLGISRQRVQVLVTQHKLDAIDTYYHDTYSHWLISDSSIQERMAFMEDWRRRKLMRRMANLATRMAEVVA